MARKPTHEELELRIEESDKGAFEGKLTKKICLRSVKAREKEDRASNFLRGSEQ